VPVKTICHVLPYLAEGGTEKTAYNIIRGLRNKYRMLLLAPRGRALPDFLELKIVYAEFPKLRGNIFAKIDSYKRRLKELHETYGIDLLHVHAAHELVSFSRSVLGTTPIIFHLHSHQGSGLSKIINYKLSALIARKKADTLVAVSDEERRLVIERGYPENKVEVIYNGFEPGAEDDWEKIAEIKRTHKLDRSIIVGNLGRLNRTKRLDLLIEAFRILKERRNEQLKLLFVGEGPQRVRLEKIAQKKLSGDAVFTGYISRGDRILKIFDLFVLPTSYEGCSNVLVEAMSKRLPIVTTDIPSVRWMFEDRKDALLFRKSSVEDLAYKLEELIKDRGLRETLSRGSYDRFKSCFTMDRMLRRVESVYENWLYKDTLAEGC
jgi:glycosyltransferase involved in cell wall biosynthesis